jgi:hypothetical protein
MSLAVADFLDESRPFPSPAVRHAGDPDKETVDARLDEQRQAEKLLSAMEKMEVGSAPFDEAFLHLREAVLEHAGSEELTVFLLLSRRRALSSGG